MANSGVARRLFRAGIVYGGSVSAIPSCLYIIEVLQTGLPWGAFDAAVLLTYLLALPLAPLIYPSLAGTSLLLATLIVPFLNGVLLGLIGVAVARAHAGISDRDG